jgi:four helix bundle protein
MFRFEKLDVWRRAGRHAGNIYHATKQFPSDERFGLTSQMRRAAVSVAANIAEGSSRASDTDFARFIEIAYGSLMELVSHANIAKLHGLLTAEAYDEIYRESEELSKMLSGLRSSLLQRNASSASGSRL